MANGSNMIPERLIGFRVYNDSNDLLGIANVTMPTIEAMSDTVSDAGIAGEVETPVLGHYGSMTTTLNWRTIEKAAMELAAPGAHQIEVRGSQQVYDAANAKYTTKAVRVTMRVATKSTNLGTFETGSTTDTEQEFEVLYIKIYVEGKAVAEVDKFNYVAKFGDNDALASVRADLGLA